MTPAVAVMKRILMAYDDQRDTMKDYYLRDEEPISLGVYLTLGEIRRLRQAMIHAGIEETAKAAK